MKHTLTILGVLIRQLDKYRWQMEEEKHWQNWLLGHSLEGKAWRLWAWKIGGRTLHPEDKDSSPWKWMVRDNGPGTREQGVPGRLCEGEHLWCRSSFRRLTTWREVHTCLHICEALAKSDTLRATHLAANHVFIYPPFIISLSWQICFLFQMVPPTLCLKKAVFFHSSGTGP